MSVLTKLYSTTGPFRLVVGFLTKCGEGRFTQVVTNDRSIYRESSVIRVNGLLKPDVLFGVLNNLPKMQYMSVDDLFMESPHNIEIFIIWCNINP